MNLILLREATILLESIEASWHKETSWLPEIWTPDNPAFGQCASTSYVLEEYLKHAKKPPVVRWLKGVAVNNKKNICCWHYWLMVNNIEIDLTLQQFPKDTKIVEVEFTDRSTVIENDWMQERCDLLLEKVREKLQQSNNRFIAATL